MTSQNEAQMNEEFDRFLGDAKYISGADNLAHLYMAFKAAYSLQQEKIDKQQVRIDELEAHVNYHHQLRIIELNEMNLLNTKNSRLKQSLTKLDSALTRYLDAEDMAAKRTCDKYNIRVLNKVREFHKFGTYNELASKDEVKNEN